MNIATLHRPGGPTVNSPDREVGVRGSTSRCGRPGGPARMRLGLVTVDSLSSAGPPGLRNDYWVRWIHDLTVGAISCRPSGPPNKFLALRHKWRIACVAFFIAMV